MTQPERAKNLAPVEASSPTDGAADGVGDDSATPILAVWLSLALVVVAGLYGLYLGTNARAQAKAGAAATSALVQPAQLMVASNECVRHPS